MPLSVLEKYINKTRKEPPYFVSEDVKEIHQQLTLVDLHADSLLWKRDLLLQYNYGHLDFHRLIAGNVAIQIFGVVTKFPVGINLKNFSLNVDLITLLSLVHNWPSHIRKDLFQRANYQAQKLVDLVARSAGKIMLIRSVSELDRFLTLREDQPNMVGALLALEGGHALNGQLSNVKKLYDSAFRIFGITHFFDNDIGGSSYGENKSGLSTFGIEVVETLQKMDIAIDLSHASERVIDEVVDMTQKPVLVSHTGVRGICDNPRNLTDDHIKKIANTGGIIGIAMFKKAICGNDIEDVARSIRYVADLTSFECVGLGSDFDGAITAPVDASGLCLLTEALLAQGFNEGQVTKIMGGNALRVFRILLPKE